MKFLIDYENINSRGLHGSEFLEKDDELLIFYSDQCPRIERQEMEKVFQSGCGFEIIKLPSPGKNALDFCIATSVGEALGRGENKSIGIISNDKGYKTIQDYWRKRKPTVRIVCRPDVAQCIISADEPGERTRRVHAACDPVDLEKEYKVFLRRRMLEEKLTDYGEKGLQLASDLSSMHEAKKIYQFLLQECGKKDGLAIYHMVKDVLIEG
ncbi:MAG: hypothetical protein IJK38_05465 [Oscillospiraceae bacterium]|nr:hypothetical protein [Oscillospiraceae bacterium]